MQNFLNHSNRRHNFQRSIQKWQILSPQPINKMHRGLLIKKLPKIQMLTFFKGIILKIAVTQGLPAFDYSMS